MKKILTTIIVLSAVVGLLAQPGYLDPSFGEGGIVVTDFDALPQYGRVLLLQPDGKIILVGYAQLDETSCPADFDLALVRYHPDGRLDTSFGDGGLAGKNFGFRGEGCPGDDFGLAAFQEPDGKILVAGQAEQGAFVDWILTRFLVDGTPDESFGDEGRIILPTARAIARQVDGKYVLAGGTFNGEDLDITLTRLSREFYIDLSFGENGVVTTDLGDSDESAEALAILPDGKIVVAGFSGSRVAVAKYLPDGSLDDTFGSGGVVTTDILGLEEIGFDLAVQPDGKIVVAGYLSRPVTCGGFVCDHQLAVIRYLPDGSLDPSFGKEEPLYEQAGVVWAPVSEAYAVALQPDGRIVAAGKQGLPSIGTPGDPVAGDAAFALARFDADGTLDTTFHNPLNLPILNPPGTVVTDIFPGAVDAIFDILIQPDGKILVGGHAGANFAVARYQSGQNPTGTKTAPPLALRARLYPNPAHGEAILEYELPKADQVTIQLLDLSGRILHVFADAESRGPGSWQEQLQFPERLPAGLFVVAVRTSRGVAFIRVARH